MKVHLDIWTECNSWSQHMEKSHLSSVDPSLSFWWWSPIAINSDTSSLLLFNSLWKAIPLAGYFLEMLHNFWPISLKGHFCKTLIFKVGVKGKVKRLHYGCIWLCKVRDGSIAADCGSQRTLSEQPDWLSCALRGRWIALLRRLQNYGMISSAR